MDFSLSYSGHICSKPFLTKFIWEALLRMKFDIQEPFQFILLDRFCSTEIKVLSLLHSFGMVRPVQFSQMGKSKEIKCLKCSFTFLYTKVF